MVTKMATKKTPKNRSGGDQPKEKEESVETFSYTTLPSVEILEKFSVYEPREEKSKLKKWIKYSLWILFFVIIFGYFYHRHTQTPEYKAEQVKKQINLLVQKTGKLIMLPQDDTPTVFDVTDPELVSKEQPFFTGSIKGDKLLVYSKTGKAIIYSPSRNIIVNAGSLTISEPASTTKTKSKK